MRQETSHSRTRQTLLTACAAVAATTLSYGCAGARPAEVSPSEIPALEEQLAREPRNGDVLLRYAAALFAAERCDSAVAVARTATAIKPKRAIGPLIMGQCAERDGDYDQALAAYAAYLEANPDEPGTPAVRSRQMFTLRARAQSRARDALAAESTLAQQPGDDRTVAVLPVEIAGDSTYLPLSRGLAQIMISDLTLIQRLRMVERLQINALLEELELSQTTRVDEETAVRMGRMLQAGRMVQGLANIPPEGDMRLEASVLLASGEVSAPEVATGRFRDLLQLEKDVVIGLAGRLGFVLSEAERRLIMENGTQNLTAFLAYSQGLEAEDLGDYQGAATFFSQAVRADPGFTQARQNYEAAAVAPEVQEASATEVTTVAETTVEEADVAGEADVASSALDSSIGDIAATQAEETQSTTTEQTTGQATNTSSAQAPTTQTQNPPVQMGTIRIVFRIP